MNKNRKSNKKKINILDYIPGFRSRKVIKIVIASIYYALVLLMLLATLSVVDVFVGFGIGLFYLSPPFLLFGVISLFSKKKPAVLIIGAVMVALAIFFCIAGENHIHKIDENVNGITIRVATPEPQSE